MLYSDMFYPARAFVRIYDINGALVIAEDGRPLQFMGSHWVGYHSEGVVCQISSP
jgi:hypothetical protein